MWESRLSGCVRGRRATEVWKRSCGTAAKAGGKQRKQTFSYSLGRLLPTRKAGKQNYLRAFQPYSLPASQPMSIYLQLLSCSHHKRFKIGINDLRMMAKLAF
jgi:hypothetical protein